MERQLAKRPDEVRRLVRAIEALQIELDFLILAEPTGHPRNQLSEANIHLIAAVDALLEVA